MKNGYYIHSRLAAHGSPLLGVIKKIELQNMVFGEHFDMHTIELRDKGNKFTRRLLPGSQLFYWNEALAQIKDPAFVYIRKPWSDQGMIDFFRKLKGTYPDVRIIVEIPTYPYDKEQFSTPVNYTLLLKDIHSRNQFRRYVDRIVSFGGETEIFGVKTIPVMNGIDVNEIKPRSPKADLNTIHLLAIASFQEYHGYDRVIQGIGDYYAHGGKRSIVLDLVGSGNVTDEYRQLSEDLGITEHVLFHGDRYGEEAMPFFENADIGLGVFGCYKRKTGISSALKTREYLAYGLPVVSGVKEDIFAEMPSPYFLRYRNCPDPVDMNRLLKFYDKCYNSGKSCGQVITYIREYAEKNVDIHNTMADVVAYIIG